LFMTTPRLSVVVVPLGGEAEVARCLEALARQTFAGKIQIIVPCDETRAGMSQLHRCFADVEFLRLHGRRTPAELRAAGVRLARAEVVALTEDHCLPEPDWCARILHEHESPHAAVGGAVEKRTPDAALNWAFFFADYLRYARPLEAGPAVHLTDCNVSYKRAALEEIGGAWSTEFHENVVHAALRERGGSLWLCPEVVVWQGRSFRFSTALWDRYAFGRLFASTRVEKAPLPRRLLLLASAPLLPLLLLGRILLLLKQKRRYRMTFLRALPQVVLLACAWAWGELTGYLTCRPHPTLAGKTKTESAVAVR
jgi:hypothetical protein